MRVVSPQHFHFEKPPAYTEIGMVSDAQPAGVLLFFAHLREADAEQIG